MKGMSVSPPKKIIPDVVRLSLRSRYSLFDLYAGPRHAGGGGPAMEGPESRAAMLKAWLTMHRRRGLSGHGLVGGLTEKSLPAG